MKPIASSTRSAGSSNSLPGTGWNCTGRLLHHLDLHGVQPFDVPVASPLNRCVETEYSRSPPSSCAPETRKMCGHCGHGLSAALLGRNRHQLELVDRQRALAVRRAEAVGAGVAAADDDDVLVLRRDELGSGMTSPSLRRFCSVR